MAHPDLAPRSLTIWLAALAISVLAYLAIAKPGPWYSPAPEIRIAPASMQIARGEGALLRGALVVERTASDGNAVVSMETNFTARDYARVTWRVRGVPPGVSAFLLWNTDVEPNRVNRVPIAMQEGALRPADVASDPHWLGRVRGIALVFHGEIDRPIEILGAEAASGDAMDTLRNRVREWLAYAPWNGSSINTVPGGTDATLLPLPLLLVAAILLATAAIAGRAWWRGRTESNAEGARITLLAAIAPSVMLVVLISWLALDLRWAIVLAGHVRDDSQRFAGKTPAAKHLALEDGALYAFVEKARAILPPIASGVLGASGAPAASGAPVAADAPAARVFVVADSNYLRGRAAYLFYPWNVWTDRAQNALPPVDQLHRGDWLVVYQRRGVEYDAATRHLRWDGGKVLDADLKLLDHGGALFELR